MEDEQQKGHQETAFGEYKRKVVECLMKDEGLTEAEARDWMSGEDENVRKYLQEGLDPLTAAQVLIAQLESRHELQQGLNPVTQ